MQNVCNMIYCKYAYGNMHTIYVHMKTFIFDLVQFENT